MADAKTILVKIKRRKDQNSAPYWEEFAVPHQPNMNVISLLMEIRKNPVTSDGKQTTAPVWDMNCLENVCGSCTMVMNGRVGQSCATLVANLQQPITLEPMTKFPTVKDLIVDRSRMFENLKKIRGWIPIDGTYDLGPGPRMNERDRQEAYEFSQCMTCGSCLEACPQVNEHSNFIGPAAIGQVRLFNSHPTGHMNADERLEAIGGSDGVTSCGNAQNCVKVCPKNIPLTDAIAEMHRDVTLFKIKRFFRGK
ncbi:succinate dehydrogenase iron-sulfur subunit [Capsulimonas corticalis]|uniref:succinate dehydrogenase n=1 Tax=Capsulimonas corticalis TaxID=2219043 RepID=A0A402CQG3_9BACT|nr:succinate dehydrogenase iron-sulfur subunit [Capsulimonas corticalis]BDI32701.1 succinate dehydrogenase iron-sulfur subunit [Capsulimonas corticalis]